MAAQMEVDGNALAGTSRPTRSLLIQPALHVCAGLNAPGPAVRSLAGRRVAGRTAHGPG
jgi:hypothetical protein